MLDKLKLAAAILLIVAGIAGFYYLQESATVIRVVSVLAGLLLGALVASTSEPGKRFFQFWRDSVAEAKKVVWPTRNEAMQTTAMVVAFAVVMAIFLWGVDAVLMKIVNLLIGRVD